MDKTYFFNVLKGLLIGSSMLIPGVSGGTVAIILGIYDKLLGAVANVFKHPKKSFTLLSAIIIGGAIGVFGFSKIIKIALESWEVPLTFLFMGAIIGSVPLLFRCAQMNKFSIDTVVYPLIGLAIVAILALIPKDILKVSTTGITGFLILFIAGLPLAVALILPGISFTYMMLVMGIYKNAVQAIDEMNILYLLPLIAGVLTGIMISAKALQTMFKRYPRKTYLVIVGFVVGSLKDVYPGLPQKNEILLCASALIVGFAIVYFITKRFSKNEAELESIENETD